MLNILSLENVRQSLMSDPGCIGIIDCDIFKPESTDFYLAVKKLHRESYSSNQKVVFILTKDYYTQDPAGLVLQSIQRILNLNDISNFFVNIITSNPNIVEEYNWVHQQISSDPTPVTITQVNGKWDKIYDHNESVFLGFNVPRNNIDYLQLSEKHKDLLENNKVFCILPWASMFIQADSKVNPCCESTEIIGDCSQQTLEEIWNGPAIKQIRKDMLAGKQIDSCKKCYFLEDNLKTKNSIRQEGLREFGKHIDRIEQTDSDGHYKDFNLLHLNLKYNNLCNLSCRMCDLSNSTSWHGPAKHMGQVKVDDKVIMIAGDKKIDVLSQICQHLDSCQQVIFEGGEPLIIEEFWYMLEELDQRQRYDVKLSYNSNLTQYKLKGKSIFDTWKKFKDVYVSASLDAEGPRGEYLRPGAKWDSIVDFRTTMIKEVPNVYFEIISTVNIFNILHLPDFHKSWVEKGLIQPSQWKLGFLHEPRYMSFLTLPPEFHATVKEKYTKHIEWLRQYDHNGQTISNFESVIYGIDHSTIPFDADDFWQNTEKLDQYYGVNFLEVFPELKNLPKS